MRSNSLYSGLHWLVVVLLLLGACTAPKPQEESAPVGLRLAAQQVSRGTPMGFEMVLADSTQRMHSWYASWQGQPLDSGTTSGTTLLASIPTDTLPVGVQVVKVRLLLAPKSEDKPSASGMDSVEAPILRFIVLAKTAPKAYTYEVAQRYDHDPTHYTQGLIYAQGRLYESTGERGHSKVVVRQGVDGEMVAEKPLSSTYFGEGIALHGDDLYHLTWTSHQGFVYDANTLELKRSFRYPTEGWGMTTIVEHTDTLIVVSDGSNRLRFYEPKTWKLVRSIDVYDHQNAITDLNELELIGGRIYANIYQSPMIVMIDPTLGEVVGKLDLNNLFDPQAYATRTQQRIDVLNGIAYDADKDLLLVTGKLWPHLYALKISATE